MDIVSQLQALLDLVVKFQAENIDLASQLEAVKKAKYDEGFARKSLPHADWQYQDVSRFQ